MAKTNNSIKRNTYIIIVMVLIIVLSVLVVIAASQPNQPFPEQSYPESQVSEEPSGMPQAVSTDESIELSEDPSDHFSEPSEPVSEAFIEVSTDISSEPSEESSEETSDEKSFPVAFIENNVKASYIAVYNYTDDIMIYTRNADSKAYPASMTKLVTAMLAIKYIPEDYVIIVGSEIEYMGENSSSIGLRKGQKMTREHILNGLLLESGNDAAYVLAVNITRFVYPDVDLSIDEELDYFYSIADDFTASLGCTGTQFACPDGYYDDEHYTTALDYIRISKEVMDNYPLIREISAKKEATYRFIGGSSKTYKNRNEMIVDSRYSALNITGLKTGYDDTDGCGASMSATSLYNGKEYIVVVMNAPSPAVRFRDVNYIFNAVYGWY